ncbi:hypothetical protein AB0K18_50240 [Nonomuraea sp. NPDC049421]|uniref:hypothetical protein n=1 Tax=Nonomuraea sp. NPDC049421 TaxID=3155275 RepID=UPI00343684FB
MMNARRTPGGLGPTGRFFGPGELRLAVLALIAEQPGHGYRNRRQCSGLEAGGEAGQPA